METARERFDVRQAPGWWPALVIVTCRRCGAESGVVDTNDRSQTTWRGQPLWMRHHACEVTS